MVLDQINVTASDTFGRLRCGVSNVIVQVAVETAARTCIGIDVRIELISAAYSAIYSHTQEYPGFLKVSVFQHTVTSNSIGHCHHHLGQQCYHWLSV
ncbi:Histone methylation protein [Phytophthora megakarya]|uniref:Histone methylation protein n=1 Tax=Phytophthora megakarya TaxID=4795 RepID=A0A225VR87_9STRA|nr:Histone methylation protein [Phytophthora megakarya]